MISAIALPATCCAGTIAGMTSNPQTAPADDDKAAAVWVDVAMLREWSQNPRKNQAAIAEVAKSIRRFGWGAPIVANRRDNEIIAGHTRYQAALRLKLPQVPVRWVDLDPADAHALALADNRIGEVAAWDDDRLREVLRDLQAVDKSLLAETGFSNAEMDSLLAEVVDLTAVEIDVSTARADFWLSVRGPLPNQPDALEKLRLALEALPGVTVELGTVQRG